MLQITDIKTDNITVKQYGGKAYGLRILAENGLKIPDTYAIQAMVDCTEIDDAQFRERLENVLVAFSQSGKYSVAVRSSCTAEDGFSDSMAGHFSTYLGEMTFNEVLVNIKAVVSGIKDAEKQNTGMGVVIQAKVEADYAGVLFSSDPISYRKDQMLMTYTEGMGDKIVSGEVEGKDILVSVKGEDYKFDVDLDESLETLLKKLAEESKNLEKKLGYPLDIEWAISEGELYFLQCRPLTSITSVQTQMIKVNEKNILGLPAQLVSHDKIALRLMAQKEDIFISDAYAYVKNACSRKTTFSGLSQSEYCRGYSAVIIYPQRVSDKVIRSFVGEKMKVYGSVTGCCRYGIRSYPDYENLDACLEGFSEKLNDDYWISTTIIQEIFDPLYTGVMQRIPEGFLVEITKGHFLTKGVVPTSQYIISDKGLVLEREEVRQEEWLKIIEGHVITCTCDDYEESLVTLSDDALKKVVESFCPVLKSDTNVVEFGVLKGEDGEVTPYLIDFVDDNSPIDISAADIKSGIISFGSISGTPVHVGNTGKDSLNEHFHNMAVESEKSDERVIFISKNPELSLLSLIEKYKPENIGFVFRNCAVGAHLAVVLREKRIPAIKTDEIIGVIPKGCICTIDAKTPGLSSDKRLLFKKDGKQIEV